MNDIPTTSGGYYPLVQEDSAFLIRESDLLSKYTDVDGDTLSITSFTLRNNGSLQNNGDSTWTITPESDFNGKLEYTFEGNDGNGGLFSYAGFFNISPINDAPRLTGQKTIFADVKQGESITLTKEQLLHGFTDVDNDDLQIKKFDLNNGNLADNGNNTWTFTPNINFSGSLNFSYVIEDNNGGSVSVNNNLNIIERRINEPPQVSGPAGLGTINEDESLIFTKTQLLSNVTDDQTELIDLSITDLRVSKGQGTLIENNDETLQNWTFIPTKDWNGEIEFSYNISDGSNTNLLDSSFYTKVNGPTWNDAQRNANILGGNLVSINSENENNWLIDNFRKDESLLLENGHTTVHIGLESNSGALKWLDNSEVVFNNVHNPQLIGLNHTSIVLNLDLPNQADPLIGKWEIGTPPAMSGIAEIPVHYFEDSIYLQLGPSTWSEAQKTAEELGGNLVSINSKEEQDFITSTFASVDDGEHAKWIGLTDKDQEGTWTWTDGSNLDFINWNPAEPSGDGDFGMMWANYGTKLNPIFPIGSWNDVVNDGAGEMSGIVEIKSGITKTNASLKVSSINDPPILTGQKTTLNDGVQNIPYIITKELLTQGFTDIDGDALHISNLDAKNGYISFNSANTSEFVQKEGVDWDENQNWHHEAH